jgi:arylsulfatase
VARWPGTIKPGVVINEIMSAEDWMPTLLAAAGEPDAKEKLLKGLKIGNKTFKNHLDGYNFQPYFKGEVAKGPRREMFYFTDNGELTAVRYDDWKVTFKTVKGNLLTGSVEATNVPWVTNLRQDPWERYQVESLSYGRWWGDKLWTLIPSGAVVGQFLQTFKEYPPSQVSATTAGVERALQAIQAGTKGAGN